MLLLSFDTSEFCLKLCLLSDGEVVSEIVNQPAGENRQEVAAMLVPSIDKLLSEASISKDQVGALVVGLGPGSFTGIRAGAVTARTLAAALKLPLIGVSTFECYASTVERPAGIVLDCAPSFYFAAAYGAGRIGEMSPLIAPAYFSSTELKERLPAAPRWYAGKAALTELAESLDHSSRPYLTALPPINNIAVLQAQIAWDRLSLKGLAGKDKGALFEQYHWSRVEPLYLRGASVTLKR